MKRQVLTEPVHPARRCTCRALLFPLGSEAWWFSIERTSI